MPIREPFPDWYHQDNLFDSRERMDERHRPILAAALAALGTHGGNVIDLGCGNGALLRKLVEANPRIVPWGIEREPERVEHAQLLLPRDRERLVVADLFVEPLPFGGTRFTLGLLSPRRFEDVPPEQRPCLRRWIQAHCDSLLVYGYGRALRDERSLVAICHRVGIHLADESPGVRASLAVRY